MPSGMGQSLEGRIVMTRSATDRTIRASMIAAIGAAITGARAVGRPDPDDDTLRFDLQSSDFLMGDIRRWFGTAKAAALEAIRAGVELTALALFLSAAGLWTGILRGII